MIFSHLSDIIPQSPRIEHFEYGYPHSNALLHFYTVKSFGLSQIRACKPHKTANHPTKCDMINVVKQYIADILNKISKVIQSKAALQKQAHNYSPALKK